jgi:hypothetical protein
LEIFNRSFAVNKYQYSYIDKDNYIIRPVHNGKVLFCVGKVNNKNDDKSDTIKLNLKDTPILRKKGYTYDINKKN